MLLEAKDTLAIPEEILRLAWSHREKVIIEIQVFLIESLNAVQMGLDRIAVESRKVILRDDILMEHDLEVFLVSPLRHL